MCVCMSQILAEKISSGSDGFQGSPLGEWGSGDDEYECNYQKTWPTGSQYVTPIWFETRSNLKPDGSSWRGSLQRYLPPIRVMRGRGLTPIEFNSMKLIDYLIIYIAASEGSIYG